MGHRVIWFDIPVTDLDRARSFYAGVPDVEISNYGEGVPVAVMEHGEGDVAGCLFIGDGAVPSDTGPLLYFAVEGRLEEATKLAGESGGKVLEQPHTIQPHGNRSVILDSEGNRICLHSEK